MKAKKIISMMLAGVMVMGTAGRLQLQCRRVRQRY